MKKAFIGTVLLGFFLFISTPVLAEPKNTIRFVFKSMTGQEVLANCGNFSYPGYLRRAGTNHIYLIQPSGLIINPRKLTYTCFLALPRGFSEARQFLVLYPSQFDHSQANSEVVLTIHHVDRKAGCISLKNKPNQILILFSLSVDGKVVEDRSHVCLTRG